jgi:iron complex transport system permease protein
LSGHLSVLSSQNTNVNQAARFWLIFAGLSLLLIAAVILAVEIGPVFIPYDMVVRIVISKLFPGVITPDWTPVQEQIVWVFRLPRALLAVLVGAALSVSGTALQALVRNPLADPYTFGISTGASVGAVLVITIGAGTAAGLTLSGAAFAGALLTMIVVYLIAQQGGQVSAGRLILAGVAISYALSSVTTFLVLRASSPGTNSAAVALSWLAGSLGAAKWEQLGIPGFIVLMTTLFLLLQSRQLNALLAGDETAVSLGVNVQRFRMQLFVLTSLLVGTVVAISGAIGFVGLMIPHIVRFLVGADHRRVLPIAALLGGAYLVLVDLIARVVIAPSELPVGIVTAAVGGPFFLWLLRQRRAIGGAG